MRGRTDRPEVTAGDRAFAAGFVGADEEVTFVARRHAIVVWMPLVLHAAAAGAVLGVGTLFGEIELARVATATLVLTISARFGWMWLVWHRRVIVVTDKNIYQRSGVLWLEEQAMIPARQITGVTLEHRFLVRWLAALLDFGDVQITTANEDEVHELRFVGRARAFKDAIGNMVNSASVDAQDLRRAIARAERAPVEGSAADNASEQAF